MKNLLPILLGLCGAAVVIGIHWLLHRVLNREPWLRAKRAGLFGLLAALFFLGAIIGDGHALLRLAFAGLAILPLLCALGVALDWPPFRDPLEEEEDETSEI